MIKPTQKLERELIIRALKMLRDDMQKNEAILPTMPNEIDPTLGSIQATIMHNHWDVDDPKYGDWIGNTEVDEDIYICSSWIDGEINTGFKGSPRKITHIRLVVGVKVFPTDNFNDVDPELHLEFASSCFWRTPKSSCYLMRYEACRAVDEEQELHLTESLAIPKEFKAVIKDIEESLQVFYEKYREDVGPWLDKYHPYMKEGKKS